jgi:hypothetical protein
MARFLLGAVALAARGQSRDTGRAMSQENIEVVRRTFDAVAREGGEGLLTFLDPEIEWQVRADLPDTDM